MVLRQGTIGKLSDNTSVNVPQVYVTPVRLCFVAVYKNILFITSLVRLSKNIQSTSPAPRADTHTHL